MLSSAGSSTIQHTAGGAASQASCILHPPCSARSLRSPQSPSVSGWWFYIKVPRKGYHRDRLHVIWQNELRVAHEPAA